MSAFERLKRKPPVPHHLAPAPLPIITASDLDTPKTLLPKAPPETPMPTTAVHRVFNTTELLEIILLQKALDLYQLFVIQRVNKKFEAVMAGSPKRRVKIFLEYSSEDLAPQPGHEAEWLLDHAAIRSYVNPVLEPALVLPLRSLSPNVFRLTTSANKPRHNTEVALPVLSDVRLGLRTSLGGGISLVAFKEALSKDKLPRQLNPRLGGSWKKMKICTVPFVLRYTAPEDYIHSVFASTVHGSHADLEELINMLVGYRSWQQHRRGSIPIEPFVGELLFVRPTSTGNLATGSVDG